MKLLLFALVLGTVAFGAPVEKLTDFELADQNLKTRIYGFPKWKVTVMTVADHKGSSELAPWIQRLRDRYQKKIDIDGVADVSKIPKPLCHLSRGVSTAEVTLPTPCRKSPFATLRSRIFEMSTLKS